MQRILTPTRAQDLFGPGKDGFSDGSPQTGEATTQLEALFFNLVQEEISNCIEYAGITLDQTQFDQLWLAISSMINNQVGPALGAYLPLVGGVLAAGPAIFPAPAGNGVLYARGNDGSGRAIVADLVGGGGGSIYAENLLINNAVNANGTITGNVLVSATNIFANGAIAGALLTSTGNIAAGGAINANGTVTGANVTATATVTGAQITSTGNIDAAGTITGGILNVGTVNATNVTATATVTGAQLTSTGNINAAGTIAAAVDLNAGSNINGLNLNATGTVTGVNVTATGTVTGAQVISTGNVSAAVTIAAGTNVIAATTVTAGTDVVANDRVYVGNAVTLNDFYLYSIDINQRAIQFEVKANQRSLVYNVSRNSFEFRSNDLTVVARFHAISGDCTSRNWVQGSPVLTAARAVRQEFQRGLSDLLELEPIRVFFPPEEEPAAQLPLGDAAYFYGLDPAAAKPVFEEAFTIVPQWIDEEADGDGFRSEVILMAVINALKEIDARLKTIEATLPPS